jgi:glycosyltransferase involved in cell wall biosynthesis
MERRKILIVLNYFYPYISGVSEYARALAESLSKSNDVRILTGLHAPELKQVERINGYCIYRAKILFRLDKGYISSEFIRLFMHLSKRSDVVNLHLPMLESGLLSLLTVKPIIATYHCDMALVGSIFNKLAVLSTRASMHIALVRAKSIVVLSKDYSTSSSVLKNYLPKVIAISPPNRLEDRDNDFSLLTKKQAENALICGFVGRLVREKGIDILIKAANELKEDHIVFWIAGDYKEIAGGSIYSEISSQLVNSFNIKLVGKLEDLDLIEFYKTIDVLLLPSTNRFEAFGMVQIEAMSYGAIPVASNMPGVRSAILNTGIGHLCKPSSVSSLVSAIKDAKRTRRKLDKNTVRNILFKSFSNDLFLVGYQSLINDLDTCE